MGIFERAMVADEADPTVIDPREVLRRAAEPMAGAAREILSRAADEPLHIAAQAGTGYGRHRLPFAKEEIRSEILCHGLGARSGFPGTRTILDIGGQDTKAIQLDEQGLVTSFQMNDRCAAGCGRYLGYVADELGLKLAELGPMALLSTSAARINSTCTVFAGTEIRERLALGETREDVVAGLHRAIVVRAISLLSRSGGVRNELTFSGGVGRNPAVVRFLHELVAEHYGQVAINVSSDSIYNGAIGAALFARMDARVAAC
jgi:benzoyl-CoA reductase subunit A